jgi:hypothetical protein
MSASDPFYWLGREAEPRIASEKMALIEVAVDGGKARLWLPTDVCIIEGSVLSEVSAGDEIPSEW